MICLDTIAFAATGPSSSVQTGVPFFEAAEVKAESVGAKTVNVLGPKRICHIDLKNCSD